MAEKSAPRRPAQRFRDYLERQLSHLQPGNRLPTGPELAQQWGVSVSTVRNTLREYQRQGKLVLIPGKGTFIPSEQAEPTLIAGDRGSSTQSVIDFVVNSMRRGNLKLGEALPSVKYMSLQFKVAPMTVVRAYGQLQQRGLITRVGKTFWVGDYDTLARPQGRKQAYFFNDSLDFTNVFKSGWMAPAYHRFERELLTHGYGFTYEHLDRLPELARRWVRSGNVPDAVIFFKLQEHQVPPLIKPLTQLVRRDERIRVLIDWRSGDARQLPRHRAVRLVSRGNIFTTRARAVADFALRKKIDVICYYFDENTTEFSLFLPVVRIRSELASLSDTARFVTAVTALRSAPSPSSFFERLHQARSPETISMVLSKYRPTDRAELEKEIHFVKDCREALTLGGRKRLYLFMHDQQAVEMAELARGMGLSVPGDISILSLENDPQYYHEGISCCIPDWEQAGYLMAHSVIDDFPVARTSKGFIRVKADVLERSTT